MITEEEIPLDFRKILQRSQDYVVVQSSSNYQVVIVVRCPICGEIGTLGFVKKKGGSYYAVIYHKTNRACYANGVRCCKISWYNQELEGYYERFREIYNKYKPNKVPKLPALSPVEVKI